VVLFKINVVGGGTPTTGEILLPITEIGKLNIPIARTWIRVCNN